MSSSPPSSFSSLCVSLVSPVLLLLLAAGFSLWYLGFFRKKCNEETSATEINQGQKAPHDISTTTKNSSSATTSKLRSIADFNREAKSHRSFPPSRDGTKGSSTDRPFQSSYYYAHNNPSAKGGYKDGLSIEDYTMNQPRLLSTNTATDNCGGGNKTKVKSEESSPLLPQDRPSGQTRSSNSGDRNDSPGESKAVDGSPRQPSVEISKFLWEDSDDVSKIRIDSLPASSGTASAAFTSWKDANISKSGVQARLINENRGLFVLLKPNSSITGGSAYHLHVPSLYGEASDVRTVWKTNKLIVVIVKKKSSTSWWSGTSASTAWPTLTSLTDNISSSHINEDLFRSGVPS